MPLGILLLKRVVLSEIITACNISQLCKISLTEEARDTFWTIQAMLLPIQILHCTVQYMLHCMNKSKNKSITMFSCVLLTVIQEKVLAKDIPLNTKPKMLASIPKITIDTSNT